MPLNLPSTGDLSLRLFKETTARKLNGLRCPKHGRAPRLRFEGSSLKDVAISLSGCCEALMEKANRAIAR